MKVSIAFTESTGYQYLRVALSKELLEAAQLQAGDYIIYDNQDGVVSLRFEANPENVSKWKGCISVISGREIRMSLPKLDLGNNFVFPASLEEVEYKVEGDALIIDLNKYKKRKPSFGNLVKGFAKIA